MEIIETSDLGFKDFGFLGNGNLIAKKCVQ